MMQDYLPHQSSINARVYPLLPFACEYLREHSSRVAGIAQALAVQLVPMQADQAYYAGLYHDIGKNYWPEKLLHMDATVTNLDMMWIRNHPWMGAVALLLEGVTDIDIRSGVQYHHERWDGSGYPYGLKAEKIHIMGRILKVADAIDAIRSDRPYSPAQPDSIVIEELIKGSGKIFDPDIAEIAIGILQISS
jgi:putative nucleotidyltransferase with HDIG domain